MYGLKRKETAAAEKPKETLAHKMVRDIIGIDPAEIIVEFNKVAEQIKAGVTAMEATAKSVASLDQRVASLDQRLGKVETIVARIEQNQAEKTAS